MILCHPSKYRFHENFYPDCFDIFSLPMKLNALLSEVFFRKYLVPLCFFNPNRLYTTIYFRFLKTKNSYHRLKSSLLHRVRGQSVFFDLVLTERNMQIKFDLRLSVYSLGVDIWLLSFKFNFGLMGWPPQPPRERVPKINKIVGFWWSILHYETRIGHFSVMVDEKIYLSNFLSEMRLSRSLRPLRLLRLLRSLKPQII